MIIYAETRGRFLEDVDRNRLERRLIDGFERQTGGVPADRGVWADERHFVARVLGTSMEPLIPDGSYCLFNRDVAGSRGGRVLLVQHQGIADPETGGTMEVNTADDRLRRRFADAAAAQREVIARRIRSAGADHLILRTDQDWLVDLARFVSWRRQRVDALSRVRP